jgi:hypothetical protein
MPRLLSTTALICVTWFSTLLSPASAADLAQQRRSGISDPSSLPDNNAKFRCYYGFSVYEHNWVSSQGSNYYSASQIAATPVKGHGKTISTIVVAEVPMHKGSFRFRVALYSDNDGKPGGQITGASTAPSSADCQLVAVSITPTMLTLGQRYWVVETGPPLGREKALAGGKWLFDVADQYRKSKAMYDTRFYCCCSTCDTGTSLGWTELSSTTDRFYVELK